MDINQMYYFVSIVQNNYNLSLTAEKIHISQPALSRFVTRLEEKENIDLFNRKSGRLIGLTHAGELVYNRSLSILSDHHLMLRELREISQFSLGSVSIGIPPIILSILMTKVLSRLMVVNPNLKIDLNELGSFVIQDQLNANRLDLGIIMSPNDMNHTIFEERIIFNEDLVVFVNENHSLANREILKWEDLHDEKVAILDDKFMINHLLIAKFSQYKIYPRIFHKVASWDFLIETAKNSDLVTILPETIHQIGKMDGLVRVPIEDPVEWKIALIFEKKILYTRLESYMINSILNYFDTQEDLSLIIPMDDTTNYPKTVL